MVAQGGATTVGAGVSRSDPVQGRGGDPAVGASCMYCQCDLVIDSNRPPPHHFGHDEGEVGFGSGFRVSRIPSRRFASETRISF